LEDAGLTPVLLTPLHSEAATQALLENCAGLVLSGGEDVDPVRYGETPIPQLGEVSAARDALEWRAIDAALMHDMPIFGICRGIQVLNVHLGGTLYQDIPAQHPAAAGHDQKEPWGRNAHEITVAADTQLYRILCRDRLQVNSFHHQAIRQLAPGLAATARTADGLIEAVEAVAYPWLLGVQWHPERYLPDTPAGDPDRLLFQAFADAVRNHLGEIP
jgi:putative glutamine amidotransferase